MATGSVRDEEVKASGGEVPRDLSVADLAARVEGSRVARDGWTLTIFVIAVATLVVAVVALDRSGRGGGGASTVEPGVVATVSLTEFAIEPAVIEVPAGSRLEIVNDGVEPHDFAIAGTALATPDIAPGGSFMLDVSGLAPGTYDVSCTIPGHATAGMAAVLRIAESGAAAAGDGAVVGDAHDHEAMSVDEMDETMAERTLAFPAETEGVGGQPLEPEVLADGTKRFELTASVIDWEIEPGVVVEAWAYNDQVPGPTIRVDTGDQVQFVLHNELPESTALHIHGIVLPNAMDGVPDITQPPIKPGESYTYEFEARETAVAMYHSHHNAAHQVPLGLAGTLLVDQLPMPDGLPVDVEYPMMLNDAGNIGFSLNGKSFPATEPLVVTTGDRVLVHYLNEGVGEHPMHLHGMHAQVVAKDGVPLDHPYMADTVNVAPGERYSILIEADEVGTWVWHCHILSHAERPDGMFGMVTALIIEEP